MVWRSVETEQNAWYENGTQKNQNSKKMTPTHKKDNPKLAHNCTAMMRDKHGVVVDGARAVGGSLVAPPIDPTRRQRYFGDVKGFGSVDELVSIVT